MHMKRQSRRGVPSYHSKIPAVVRELHPFLLFLLSPFLLLLLLLSRCLNQNAVCVYSCKMPVSVAVSTVVQ